MEPEVTNPRKKWLIIGSIVVLVILLGIGGYFLMQSDDQITTVTTPSTSASIAPTATPVTKTRNYFASDSTLVDLVTGATQTFIPEGYTINGTASYPQFPTYLILEKDKQLFAYTIATKEIRKINITPIQATTPTFTQYAAINTSINDKTKAYIVVRSFEGKDEGLGDAPPTSAKAYFYDFVTNTVTAAEDTNLPTGTASKCYEYDSQFTRFITWPCGEGIGSATPLSVYDYTTKTTKEIVSGDTMYVRTTAQKNNLLVINYENGLTSQIKTITRIKADKKEITQEQYTVADSVKAQTTQAGYGAIFIDEKNTIVMGGSDSLTLLSFNTNKQITAATIVPEPQVYANFLFTDKEKLYYMIKDKLQVVDLETKKVVKSHALKAGLELGLVALPE